MNLIYGLALHEFSLAQVDRAPARCFLEIINFSFSDARDVLTYIHTYIHDFISSRIYRVAKKLISSRKEKKRKKERKIYK